MVRLGLLSPTLLILAIRTEPLKAVWILAVLLVGTGGFLLPAPSTMISLKSTSETVTLDVSTSRGASIYLSSAWNETDESCVHDVRLEPDPGASVSYARAGSGPLYITATGGWVVKSSNQQVVHKVDFISYEIGNVERTCDLPDVVRLPATGYLSVGSENVSSPDEETLLVLSAELAIYGRSIDRIFGILPLTKGPFRPNSLYFVESVTVPGGSRISNARGYNGDRIIWWGFVDVLFNDASQEAMVIRASANAASVDLFAPPPTLGLAVSTRIEYEHGGSMSAYSQQPDVIHFSYGARLLQDPNLRWLYALLTGILLLVQVAKHLSVSIDRVMHSDE